MPSLVRQSFRLGFLVAMLGLPLRNLAAQSGTIQGQVTDSSGGAVSGAIVTVEKTSLRVDVCQRCAALPSEMTLLLYCAGKPI